MSEEVFNKQLFEDLLKLEPEWRYGTCFKPEEAKQKIEEYYEKISCLLASYGIRFKPDCYHKKRGEDRIELTRETRIVAKQTKKTIEYKKGHDSLIIRPAQGRVTGKLNVDPETAYRQIDQKKEEVIFNDEF